MLLFRAQCGCFRCFPAPLGNVTFPKSPPHQQIQKRCLPRGRWGPERGLGGGRLEAGTPEKRYRKCSERLNGQRFPVAVPGVSCARRSGLAPCRPLPLAQVAVSASGGAPLAPPEPVLWFLSYRHKKGTPPAGTGTNNMVEAFRFKRHIFPSSRNTIPQSPSGDSPLYTRGPFLRPYVCERDIGLPNFFPLPSFPDYSMIKAHKKERTGTKL